jgi:hypothetical protein
MTMPRPSLVTSSGPSPVRGFIAAIRPSPSSAPHRSAHPGTGLPGCCHPWHCACLCPVRTVEPASHNRFYLSPYYPVFGSRLVMIGHPGRPECAGNSLFRGRSGPDAGRWGLVIAPACRALAAGPFRAGRRRGGTTAVRPG